MYGAAPAQVFGGVESSTSLQLRVYDGKLMRYKSETLATSIYGRWLPVSVTHDTATHEIKIYVRGALKLTARDRGTEKHYFKLGVYGQAGSSNKMEARYRNIVVKDT